MPAPLSAVVLALLLATCYLLVSRNVLLKRWLLPLTTAGLAAVSALLLASSSGGDFAAYAVGVPLGLSGGLTLHHFLDFCRACGATRALRVSSAQAGSCTGCRKAHVSHG